MNIFELEELLSENHINEKYLVAFKNKVQNEFDTFFEEIENEIEYKHGHEKNEHGILPNDIQEYIDADYYELSLHSITQLCSDLNISIELFKEYKHSGLFESEIPFTSYRIYGIWKYITGLDNLPFLVAAVSLMNNISESMKFGKWFAALIKKALKAYKLEFVLEIIFKNQVFIAMSFDKSMERARDKIKQAVYDSGYYPFLIDEKEHNNFIVPEIFFEIKKSKFVIADFTGNKGGVYYEAGYAKALNKEVIMTVKQSDFKKVHFDTKQVSHIIWADEDDLYQRLLKRIEATL